MNKFITKTTVTMRRVNNKYIFIIAFGLILWFAETAYFGWNREPSCEMERMLDTIAMVAIFWGIIGDIAKNIVVVKN